MKNSKAFLAGAVVIALLSVTVMSGCKKDSNNTPSTCSNGVKDGDETGVDCGGSCNACTAASARVKTYSLAAPTFGNSIFTYTYDSHQRIATVTLSGSLDHAVISYTYGANSITITSDQNRNSSVLTLNASGYAISAVGKDSANNTLSTDTYTYDSDGHLLTSTSSGETNTWSNGNLATNDRGAGDIYSYTYLTNKVNTMGNENVGRAFNGKSSLNLVDIETVSGSGSTAYSYQYDSQNRVTQAVHGNETETYTYY
jgi:hypothetical protein